MQGDVPPTSTSSGPSVATSSESFRSESCFCFEQGPDDDQLVAAIVDFLDGNLTLLPCLNRCADRSREVRPRAALELAPE